MDYLPTSTDLYIILLSYVGFQRLDYHNQVILPILKEEKSDGSSQTIWKIGSAGFDPYKIDDEKKPDLIELDKIGYPVYRESFINKKGELDYKSKFFMDGDRKRTFQELNPDELKYVEGIHLKKGEDVESDKVTPYVFREVFHGKVDGVPAPSEKSKIFDEVSKLNWVKIEGKRSKGYYEFCNWVLEYLNLDLGGRVGQEKAVFISEAVRTLCTHTVFKVLELRDKLATEDFIPVLGLVDTYFLVEAYDADTEKGAMNWFGKFHKDLIEKIKEGNVFEVISSGFYQALEYISNKLANNPNFETQGRLLHAMVKLGKNLDTMAIIRPETPFWADAKMRFTDTLARNMKSRLDAIKKEFDSSILARFQNGMSLSGHLYIHQEYAMQFIAWLQYQGKTPDEIAKLTGFKPNQVDAYLNKWESDCKNNKLSEQEARVKATSVLDKICQGPALKSLKSYFTANNLIATGGKMVVGGGMGAAHVAPFITIVAPVLQAIGYTLVAVLEACTLSPIYDFSNPDLDFTDPENYYYGGCITWSMMNPDTNIALAILMAAGVYLTDYMEFGSGAFQGVRCGIDMDWVNVVLAGMQGGMMTLGMGYVSEDTLADLFKPLLPIFGALAGLQYGGPLGALIGLGAGGAVGVVSMLPQVDQFYKEYIWPAAKLMIGTSLMGKVTTVLTSALANMAAMTGINALENAWVNNVMGLPWMQDVTLDFTAFQEYLPGYGFAGYDYIANYITHYIYGMY